MLILGQIESVALGPPPGLGNYFQIFKVVVMIAALFLWAFPASWCSRDAKRLSLNQFLWGMIILVGGAFGWLSWFFIPIYGVGLLFYVLLGFGTVLAYALYRDSIVEDDDKVLTFSNIVSAMKGERKAQKVDVKEKVRFANMRGIEPKIPEEPELQKVYQSFQDLLFDGLWRRSEEILLQPSGEKTRLIFKIDGVSTEYAEWERARFQAVVDYVKSITGMDISEKRQPQKGKLVAQQVNVDRKVNLDITTAGSTAGERMTIKVRAEESKFTITDIGLTEEQITKLKPILDMKSGLILVSGLGSSGVTTTLYAIGRSLDAFMQNIHSVEMKPLMELDNITQNIFHGGDDKSFPKLIQSISRREPDVILIDPCQDTETAKMLVQIVADKKKKIFTVVRASNALSALARFVRWSENPSASSEVIQAVSFVRLLRKLCPTCREAYHPNADTLRKMNISANSQVTFYRPPTQLVDKKGRPMICTTCQGSGYVGRTGVFELLIMNDQIREAILSGDNSRLKSAARKSGCKSWEEMALEKIMSGVTSVQEVIRVSKEAELAAGKAKQR